MSAADESGRPPLLLQAEALLQVLDDRGVEFVIVGGFALSAHGVVRATKDSTSSPRPRATTSSGWQELSMP